MSEDEESYRTKWLDASKARRELRKKLKKTERALAKYKTRAERAEESLREAEDELVIMRREVNLHRTIRNLTSENDRLRRTRRSVPNP